MPSRLTPPPLSRQSCDGSNSVPFPSFGLISMACFRVLTLWLYGPGLGQILLLLAGSRVLAGDLI